MRKLKFIFLFSLLISSCEKDDYHTLPEEPEQVGIPEETPGQTEVPDESGEENSVKEDPVSKILIYNEALIEDSYVLINNAASNRVYLIEKNNGKIIFEWDLPSGIGNDAELLPNGNLLVALTDDDPAYTFGGFGGRMAIIDPQGEIVWDFKYSDEFSLSHHDLEILPNGNIIFIAWEKKTGDDLKEVGFTGDDEQVYAEKILEINPNLNEIVWEWNVWDHLIQDRDTTSQNFGVISERPMKVNINYEDALKDGDYKGDIFHANALEYDEENNLIYLSVNYFSEVWVIDHSTTTAEASSSKGGNYDKGGDLVYRFGNPEAYNGSGERLFFHNHNPNLVAGGNSLLVYSNGIPSVDPHSTVYELKIPEIFNLETAGTNELEILWSFSDPDLFSAKVSGAYRLANGNTLITQGTFGFWEVTNTKEVVWKYKGEGFFWRGYPYSKESDAIKNLGI
ncbi:aryl-sulfate sulfotransferase [Gramella sp. AN32]|uniref:Aryl-sulfate sulfotransferase n=1 Tax=Christiangramia antarctica TaxID=2058158 RepID=A0ABW5X3U7_9FLAO|nr:aryl-sulfate sulfotransferase [Gramella sp. AN32]MCM4156598.1 hypothetical protein [Gramella sp. AN32]